MSVLLFHSLEYAVNPRPFDQLPSPFDQSSAKYSSNIVLEGTHYPADLRFSHFATQANSTFTL